MLGHASAAAQPSMLSQVDDATRDDPMVVALAQREHAVRPIPSQTVGPCGRVIHMQVDETGASMDCASSLLGPTSTLVCETSQPRQPKTN